MPSSSITDIFPHAFSRGHNWVWFASAGLQPGWQFDKSCMIHATNWPIFRLKIPPLITIDKSLSITAQSSDSEGDIIILFRKFKTCMWEYSTDSTFKLIFFYNHYIFILMPHPFQCSLFLTSYVCYIFHIFITHVDYRHFDFLGLFLFGFFLVQYTERCLNTQN